MLKACWKRVESNLNWFKLSCNIDSTFLLFLKILNGVEAVWTLPEFNICPELAQHPFNFVERMLVKCWNRLKWPLETYYIGGDLLHDIRWRMSLILLLVSYCTNTIARVPTNHLWTDEDKTSEKVLLTLFTFIASSKTFLAASIRQCPEMRWREQVTVGKFIGSWFRNWFISVAHDSDRNSSLTSFSVESLLLSDSKYNEKGDCW